MVDNGQSFKAGYVYVPGIAPLDRRGTKPGRRSRRSTPEIKEVAHWGTINNPIANSIADQTAAVLRANPDISVIFAPSMSSPRAPRPRSTKPASTPQIEDLLGRHLDAGHLRDDRAEERLGGFGGHVVGGGGRGLRPHPRAAARRRRSGQQVIVPPTLITQKLLLDKGIQNMNDLAAKTAAVLQGRRLYGAVDSQTQARLILVIGENAQRTTGPFGRSFSIAIPSSVQQHASRFVDRPVGISWDDVEGRSSLFAPTAAILVEARPNAG